MSWAKLDDVMPKHWKIEDLSDSAFRAHVTAICHCSEHLTNGLVLTKKAKDLARPKVLEELTRERRNPYTGEYTRLWEPVEDGFLVHDYLEYNPTREQVLAEREKAKKRMRAVRSPEQAANIGGSSPSPYPARPDPVPIPNQDYETNGGVEVGNQDNDAPADLPPSFGALKAEWENRIGFIPPADLADFKHFAEALPQAWFMAAIDETVKQKRPSWAYCVAILRTCENEQRPPSSIRKHDEPRPKSRRFQAVS